MVGPGERVDPSLVFAFTFHLIEKVKEVSGVSKTYRTSNLQEKKDAHPKNEECKEAKLSHQEMELPMSSGNSIASCMLRKESKKESRTFTDMKREQTKEEEAAREEDEKEIPEFTKNEVQSAIDSLKKRQSK